MPEEFPLTYTILSHEDKHYPSGYGNNNNNNNNGGGNNSNNTWRRTASGRRPHGGGGPGYITTTVGGDDSSPVYTTFCRDMATAAGRRQQQRTTPPASSTMQRRRYQWPPQYENQPRLLLAYNHQTSLPTGNSDYPAVATGYNNNELALPPPPDLDNYLSQLSLPAYLDHLPASSTLGRRCDTPASPLRQEEAACETPAAASIATSGDSRCHGQNGVPLYSLMSNSSQQQQQNCNACLPTEGFELTAMPISDRSYNITAVAPVRSGTNGVIVPCLEDPVVQEGPAAVDPGRGAVEGGDGLAASQLTMSSAYAGGRPIIDPACSRQVS